MRWAVPAARLLHGQVMGRSLRSDMALMGASRWRGVPALPPAHGCVGRPLHHLPGRCDASLISDSFCCICCWYICRYEFFADELPIWGFVGPPPEQTKGDDNVYIYTHKTFDIAYNGDRVRAAAQQGSTLAQPGR